MNVVEEDNKNKKIIPKNVFFKNEINELSTEIDSTKKKKNF